jgi:hypothetical protein
MLEVMIIKVLNLPMTSLATAREFGPSVAIIEGGRPNIIKSDLSPEYIPRIYSFDSRNNVVS